MKILMVAIPNHHFFQWVNQLKDAGHEVIWFDITDGGSKSHKIEWVKQIIGWKLKWNYPLRQRLKKSLPKLHQFFQKYNTNTISSVFEALLESENPDVIHCFEMELTGFPILQIMQKNVIPLMYSSWGSDLYYFKENGKSELQVQRFLERTNYLITDCKRDHTIALKNGFNGSFLGVFPGNGGLALEPSEIKPISNRDIILIKGYDDGVGKASVILKGLEMIPSETLAPFKIIIYSADQGIQNQINNSKHLTALNIKVQSRYQFLQNKKLLAIMGASCIHIANSLSDGMPNALLEAMGMGAFPIQSNPGKATEEVITNYKNGFLIENPLDEKHIASLIIEALSNKQLRQQAQDYNVKFIQDNYNRVTLQPKIIALYNTVFSNLS